MEIIVGILLIVIASACLLTVIGGLIMQLIVCMKKALKK
jgi:hypothetical protein